MANLKPFSHARMNVNNTSLTNSKYHLKPSRICLVLRMTIEIEVRTELCCGSKELN